MRLLVLGVVAATALAASATQAAADNFGAIAYSTGSGAIGYSYDYGSRDEAEEHALQECGPGCQVVVWFKNACGAVAAGSDRGYGTGWADSRGEAEETAMRYCQQNSQGCRPVGWTCTSR